MAAQRWFHDSKKFYFNTRRGQNDVVEGFASLKNGDPQHIINSQENAHVPWESIQLTLSMLIAEVYRFMQLISSEKRSNKRNGPNS